MVQTVCTCLQRYVNGNFQMAIPDMICSYPIPFEIIVLIVFKNLSRFYLANRWRKSVSSTGKPFETVIHQDWTIFPIQSYRVASFEGMWPALIDTEQCFSLVQVWVQDYPQLYYQIANTNSRTSTCFQHAVTVCSTSSFCLLVTN